MASGCDYLIRAIIFDIGGVLVISGNGHNYESTIRRLVPRVARKLGISPKSFSEAKSAHRDQAARGLITKRQYLAGLSAATGASSAEIDRVYSLLFSSSSHVNEGMMALATRLKEGGYRLAAISNVTKLSLDASVFESRGLFDPLLQSCEVGMKKPEAGIFRLALRKLHLPAKQCVFIDDVEENVRAARKLGMHAVLHVSLPATMLRLRKLGVRV